MTKAIEVNNLNYHVKDFSLNDIQFDVKKGYVTGFIGASCKTTNRDSPRLVEEKIEQTKKPLDNFWDS